MSALPAIPSAMLGRIKRAVRDVVDLCGGVDGAAATVGKSRSLTGSWRNINQTDLPTLGDALALDEVACSMGHAPPILSRYAAELGHVAIRLPDPALGEDELTKALIEASAEFGDIAHAVCEATRDGLRNEREDRRIVSEIDQAMAKLVRMRLLVAGPGGLVSVIGGEPAAARKSGDTS